MNLSKFSFNYRFIILFTPFNRYDQWVVQQHKRAKFPGRNKTVQSEVVRFPELPSSISLENYEVFLPPKVGSVKSGISRPKHNPPGKRKEHIVRLPLTVTAHETAKPAYVMNAVPPKMKRYPKFSPETAARAVESCALRHRRHLVQQDKIDCLTRDVSAMHAQYNQMLVLRHGRDKALEQLNQKLAIITSQTKTAVTECSLSHRNDLLHRLEETVGDTKAEISYSKILWRMRRRSEVSLLRVTARKNALMLSLQRLKEEDKALQLSVSQVHERCEVAEQAVAAMKKRLEDQQQRNGHSLRLLQVRYLLEVYSSRHLTLISWFNFRWKSRKRRRCRTSQPAH